MSARQPLVPLVAWTMAAPIVWVSHFALSYATIAVACARASDLDRLAAALGLPAVALPATALAVFTFVALAGIAWTVRREQKRQRMGMSVHSFMAWMARGLAVLLAAAMALQALLALAMADCRG